MQVIELVNAAQDMQTPEDTSGWLSGFLSRLVDCLTRSPTDILLEEGAIVCLLHISCQFQRASADPMLLSDCIVEAAISKGLAAVRFLMSLLPHCSGMFSRPEVYSAH